MKVEIIEEAERENTAKTIDRTAFEFIYAGQPRWEIGRPQKAILDVADRVTGSVLDAFCGTGENALVFAGRGQRVTGIDFLAEAICLAKRKAAERGLAATFLETDALALKDLPEVFDSAIDSGLFHETRQRSVRFDFAGRPDPARGRDPHPYRQWCHQQASRRPDLHQREDRRTSPGQHLHQARGVIPDRCRDMGVCEQRHQPLVATTSFAPHGRVRRHIVYPIRLLSCEPRV